MIDSTIGIDPGPTTGMCFLDYEAGQLVGKTLLQCDAASAAVVLKGLLYAYYDSRRRMYRDADIGRRVGSVEKFVTGASAGTRGKAADVTRELVMELTEVLQLFGYAVKIRAAADVKPKWTDKRLVAAGVAPRMLDLKHEFRHAHDAARHCLCGAREAGVIADPLLKKREIAGVNLNLVIHDEIPGWLDKP